MWRSNFLRWSEIATFIGGGIAFLMFLNTLLGAESAPQQGAGAALALCWVVIPYCITGTLRRKSNWED